VGEESAGDAKAKEAESSCLRAFQGVCRGSDGRVETRSVVATLSTLSPPERPKSVGVVTARSLDVSDLNWTAPSTKSSSLSKKKTPGMEGSMKSAAM
jgi:hypothetical protein